MSVPESCHMLSWDNFILICKVAYFIHDEPGSPSSGIEQNKLEVFCFLSALLEWHWGRQGCLVHYTNHQPQYPNYQGTSEIPRTPRTP